MSVDMAFDQAMKLGHSWVGPQHFMLGVLEKDSLVTRVLSGFGITYTSYLEMVEPMGASAKPRGPEEGLGGPNPAGCYFHGRAHGWGLAAGRAQPAAEDYVVAAVFDAHSFPMELDHFGTTPAEVAQALRSSGIRIPDVDPPPPYVPWKNPMAVYVAIELLDPICKILYERHPPGSVCRWGMNTDPDDPERGHLFVEEGIDIDGVVDEARLSQA